MAKRVDLKEQTGLAIRPINIPAAENGATICAGIEVKGGAAPEAALARLAFRLPVAQKIFDAMA